MIGKYLRRRPAVEQDDGPAVKKRKCDTLVTRIPVEQGEQGSGTPQDPFRLPLRDTPNRSGCAHCPIDTCECVWMSDALCGCYDGLQCKREVVRYHKSELCAKSILPPFVSRLVRLAALKPDDVFYDFGCGNGSVLFQVALLTGCRCVGVEINPTNARVAQEAWRALRPTLEKRCGHALHVDIVCADVCTLLKDEAFFTGSCVIWAANLLLPKSVNHYLSERLRSVPLETRIFCFEDLYPHSRRVAALRDPDAFARFDMKDYRWQSSSVEWCDIEGLFYQYTRR